MISVLLGGQDCSVLRTRLSLEQLFTLESRDVTDGRKDVGTVGCGTLDTVSDGIVQFSAPPSQPHNNPTHR
jgi:hypothetical protein